MNDFYAKDIGNKIRAGYRQKQREGIVITLPCGYWKDKNRNEIRVNSETAMTVQIINSLHLQGYGQKDVACRLNSMEQTTLAQLRTEKQQIVSADLQNTWRSDPQAICQCKKCTGGGDIHGHTNNHRREPNNGKVKYIEEADWYRHEDFFPLIIEKEEWERVQYLLKQQARPANGDLAKHRYAGLLTCRECGNVFIPMIRYWNGKRRVEYVCRGYHRNGKSYCTSHRIHEEVLDAAVQSYVETMREQYTVELKQLVKMQKTWALRNPVLDAHILSLQKEIQRLEQEIDGIVMEQIMNYRTVFVNT